MIDFTRISGASSRLKFLAISSERDRNACALSTNVKQLSAAKRERIELSELMHVPPRLHDIWKSRVRGSYPCEASNRVKSPWKIQRIYIPELASFLASFSGERRLIFIKNLNLWNILNSSRCSQTYNGVLFFNSPTWAKVVFFYTNNRYIFLKRSFQCRVL